MPDLSACDLDELEARLIFLISSLEEKLKSVSPILETIAKFRIEIADITDELRKR